jgi:hypothetical protein
MKTIRAAFALPILAMALASIPSMAQDHPDNHTYKQHQEWKAGSKIQQEDWNRGDKVDIGRTTFAIRQREMSGVRSMGIT